MLIISHVVRTLRLTLTNIFRPGSSGEKQEITKTVNNCTQKELNIISFNCKNIKTCSEMFQDSFKDIDLILLQEHWLFTCELHLLNELHNDYIGIGKAVDQLNPLPPVRLPRGYGGVGILWHRRIDHLVTSHTIVKVFKLWNLIYHRDYY